METVHFVAIEGRKFEVTLYTGMYPGGSAKLIEGEPIEMTHELDSRIARRASKQYWDGPWWKDPYWKHHWMTCDAWYRRNGLPNPNEAG